MRHGDVMTVDRVGGRDRLRGGVKVRDDLMAEQVEVDPLRRRAPLGAAEQRALNAARGGKVVDREGEMEGAWHGLGLAPRQGADNGWAFDFTRRREDAEKRR